MLFDDGIVKIYAPKIEASQGLKPKETIGELRGTYPFQYQTVSFERQLTAQKYGYYISSVICTDIDSTIKPGDIVQMEDGSKYRIISAQYVRDNLGFNRLSLADMEG